MSTICIAYVTSRYEPRLDWFLASLYPQLGNQKPQLIVVDSTDRAATFVDDHFDLAQHVKPKPTVWQGASRLTKEDWWAVSNARNTAICLCAKGYIVFVDDRCVLSPTWFQAVWEAAVANVALCGTYEKRKGMIVSGGTITEPGELLGSDCRLPHVLVKDKPQRCPGQWFFGGTLGMPLEWALAINGFEECMDGLSAEDCMAGLHLQNNGLRIMFDPRAKIIEDRTPGHCEPVMKRSSKEKHPNDTSDKGHEAFRRFGKLKRTSHHWNLRAVRNAVLCGHPFPEAKEPKCDWFDGQPLSEM